MKRRKKSKRLNFKDDFEMLYLRHEYISKAKKLDGSFISKYAGIVHTTAKIMFNRLTNFEKVGFTQEDIIAITNIYMLSYMALYSIQTNPKEMENVLKKRKVEFLPISEVVRIDRNRLINFLRQRLHHCGTLCARKARNITVGYDKRGIFAETEETSTTSKELILQDYKKYGYRKVTLKEYKLAVIRAKEAGAQDITDLKGFKIFKLESLNDGIREADYRLLMESNDSFFNNTPEVILQKVEEEAILEKKRNDFNALSPEERGRILSTFLRRNKGDKTLKKELKLAKKMLKNDDNVVLLG